MFAAAGRQRAHQGGDLRDFLRPLEQTARLCEMRFAPPYVLYGSLRAPTDGRLDAHVDGYRTLLEAIRDDRYDWDAADDLDVVQSHNIPLRGEG